MTTLIECRICFSVPTPQTFMDCEQCRNKVCTKCFANLRALECPFCRRSYVNICEEEWSESSEEEWSESTEEETKFEVPYIRPPQIAQPELCLPRRRTVYELQIDSAMREAHAYLDQYLTGRLELGDVVNKIILAREFARNA